MGRVSFLCEYYFNPLSPLPHPHMPNKIYDPLLQGLFIPEVQHQQRTAL